METGGTVGGCDCEETGVDAGEAVEDRATCTSGGWEHVVTTLFEHLAFLPGRQSTHGFLALAQTQLIQRPLALHRQH